MATLTPETGIIGADAIVPQVLTTDDQFTFKAGARQVMMFQNDTGGARTITIDGDAAVDFLCPGTDVEISVSDGYEFVVPDGESYVLILQTISRYLVATNNIIDITSDVGGVNLFFIEF